MENIKTCLHPDKYKSYTWNIQKFSNNFDTEFKYCFCQICKSSEYSGEYRFVEKKLNREELPSAKEQNLMSKEKLSVSSSLKARFAKEGAGMSLKQFARMLVKQGDKVAADWFDNKQGACNASRTKENTNRVALERVATRSAKRKKKDGATTPAPTTKGAK